METGLLEKKKRRGSVPAEAFPLSRREVRQQLSLASGESVGENKDPVSSVTENFRQTFDSIGCRRAGALTQDMSSGENIAARRTGQAENQAVYPDSFPGQRESIAGHDRQTPQRTDSGQTMPESGILLEKFSETAFRRGTLSASVLGGTGKMMLVSCLKRSGAQTDPNSRNEAALFGTGNQTRNVPGHAPDRMLFSRGVVNSAVGLVVDTLRDARQTVDTLRDMALGTGELRGGIENSALLKLYPFLDTSREKAMAEQYEARLRENTDVQERAVLQNALVHTRAMLDRKVSMKEEFINKLRQISDRAVQALEEFEAPGFGEEVWRAVSGQEANDENIPPDDGDVPPDSRENIPPDDENMPQDGENLPPENAAEDSAQEQYGQ